MLAGNLNEENRNFKSLQLTAANSYQQLSFYSNKKGSQFNAKIHRYRKRVHRVIFHGHSKPVNIDSFFYIKTTNELLF